MMKKIMLVLAFGWVIKAYTQPVITQAEFPFVAGHVFSTFYSTYSTPSEGASQSWDYTGFDVSSPTTVYTIDPGTSGITGLPASSVCTDNNGSMDCFLVSSTGVERTGLGGFGVNVPYSDPESIVQFPISYSDADVDSFFSSYVTSGFNGVRRGIVNMDVSGYGTLLLPNSITINNVLQVKLHEVYTDSMDVFGDWQVINFDFTTYQFYAANYPGDILTMSYGIAYSPIFGYDTVSTGKYNILTIGSGLESKKSRDQFFLYPNPCKGEFSLKTNETISLIESGYSITNSYGQTVQTGLIKSDNQVFNIDDLPPGIYLLMIHTVDGTISKKIIRQ